MPKVINEDIVFLGLITPFDTSCCDLMGTSVRSNRAKGINVNAIAPTVFRTALTQWMFDDQERYKVFLRRIPIGRLGEPEDFIGAVLYLSSSASDFMTGAIMYVDGGYTAG